MKVAAIIPAAGAGKRLKCKVTKALKKISGRPLLIWTVQGLTRAHAFEELIVVAEKTKLDDVRNLLKKEKIKNLKVVAGGQTRAESVFKGLSAVTGSDYVLVHDAARPLVSKVLIKRLLKHVVNTGAVICGLSPVATVKRRNKKGFLQGTEDRRSLFLAQTPQVFKRKLLLDRYAQLGKKAFRATDEAALFDGTQTKVLSIDGDPMNIKITVPEDLELMEFFLESRHRLRHSRA